MTNFSFFRARKLDKKGVFGLTSVQAFFALILGLALLAYVTVATFGILQGTSIVPAASQSVQVANESGWINSTGDFLNSISVPGFSSPAILVAINGSSGTVIPTSNYTLRSDGYYSNATASGQGFNNANITYTYNFNSQIYNNANGILANTSVGITAFFTSINPVYAILAIMVIILVLVVLVRVVSGNQGNSNTAGPQL